MRYIFIVGLPRTGTKLMRSVLEASPDVCVRFSPEMWFFGDLFRAGIRARMRRIGDMTDDGNVRRLVDSLFEAHIPRTYWRELKSGRLAIRRDALVRGILESDRSDKGVYQALLMAAADARRDPGDTRELMLGEKMPGNLYYVPTLLEWFPAARIVHTFRDPRAILASEWRRLMDRRRGGAGGRLTDPLYSVVVVLYVTSTWLYASRLHRRYAARYPDNYRLFRYEDLVQDPARSIAGLCEHVGIDMHEGMLAPERKGSSFDQARSTGFDRDAVHRWQGQLKPWMKLWLRLWGGRSMKRLGYLSP